MLEIYNIYMIGKPEWFKRRKYGGWGFQPKTWQGWVYITVLIGVLVGFQSLGFWTTTTRIYFTIGWIAFLLLDTTHIMISLDRDEREYRIEAVSERNAAWFMAVVLSLGVVYQIIMSSMEKSLSVDPVLVVALFGGMGVKSVSNYYISRKGLDR